MHELASRRPGPTSGPFLPRLGAVAVALLGLGCRATPPDIAPRPDDFAQLQFRAASTNFRSGPRNLDLRRRLAGKFDGLVELSPSGITSVVRVPGEQVLDWTELDRVFLYAGYRLDSVALYTEVEVVDGVLRITATGQELPPGPVESSGAPVTAELPEALPAAQRWVEVRGTGPAWPLTAQLMAAPPTLETEYLVPGGK